MKKIAIMFSLGVLMAGTSFAQTQTSPQKNKKAHTEHRGAKQDGVKKARKSPEEMAQMRTDKMSEQLGLNAFQKNQLQALNLKQAQEMQAMRGTKKNAENRSQAREARKASHARWQAELKSILSAQQYAKYEANQAEKRSRFEGRQDKGSKENRGPKQQRG